MSLVAYGSSDESSDEEVISKEESSKHSSEIIATEQTLPIVEVQQTPQLLPHQSKAHISLPAPKRVEPATIIDENKSLTPPEDVSDNVAINFNLLPKPKPKGNVGDMIQDDDEFIPPRKSTGVPVEKPPVKKEKAPVKISVPSLSDFKDLDAEREISRAKIKPSQKGTGLFAVLPPPRSETFLQSKSMVPRVLTKKPANPEVSSGPQQPNKIEANKMRTLSMKDKKSQKSSIAANYDSNSEDEDNSDTASKMDFFSLSTSTDVPIPSIPIADIVNETLKYSKSQFNKADIQLMETSTIEKQQPELQLPNKTLVSTVMNLPREEIIQKNKADVGPKLPVPEQDYNVDSTGNVVFDDKAIEYLCGKRGVKRKNKDFDGVDIIEINGEDIKPDEREWLVKALTEEPVRRPSASQGAGPSSQSKKKHQITYLAHQAKAMEVELKNQWAQNKMTRQQTQSKYGF